MEKSWEERGTRARLAFKPRGERLEHFDRCGLWLGIDFGCFGEGKVLEMSGRAFQEVVDCVLL